MLNKKIILFLVLHFGLILNLLGQDKAYDIFQLRFLYNEVKFQEVIEQGKKILNDPAGLSSDQLIEIHKYMALSTFNVGQRDSSKAHFFTILTLDSEFEPDPVTTSPKILSFFQDIKKSFTKNEEQIAIPYNQYVFIEDIRPNAALRSLLLPGWGQYYKEQEGKAYILGGAFLGTSIVTVITYSIERDLRSKYRNEKDIEKVGTRYNDYNTMSKTRRVFQYAALTVWTSAIFDALFSEYNPNVAFDENSIGMTVTLIF